MALRFRLALIRLAGTLGLALAAGLPATPPAAAATLAETECPKAPMRLAVIGDSLADGIWGSLYRSFARCETMQILRLTEVSDGLAKSPAADWLAKYRAAGAPADSRDSDIAIVQIGANDITTIRDGRTRVSFSAEEWDAAYTARAAELARDLKAKTAKLLWVGLPVVGKSDLEGPYQAISGLQKAAVAKAGGTFVDIHGATMFGSGAFAMNGEFQGRMQQLRASDQVHFTKAGYDFVADTLRAELQRMIIQRNRAAALADVEIQ